MTSLPTTSQQADFHIRAMERFTPFMPRSKRLARPKNGTVSTCLLSVAISRLVHRMEAFIMRWTIVLKTPGSPKLI